MESFQVEKDAEDENRMNEMIIENDFYDEFVPDKEDDPNLMVEEESFKPNRNAKQEVNSEQTEKRFKRFHLINDDDAALRTSNNYNQTDGNSEVEMKQEPIKGKRFSVYRLASPFIHFSLRVEVFRKHFGKWLRICPQMILTSESEKISDGDFHVGLSPRNTSNYFPDFDVNKTFLLLSEDGTSLQSLLTLDNSSSLNIKTAIRQSICRSEIGADTAAQSSLLMLSETVLNHEQAITKCSLNDDKFCLDLKDDDDTSK
ncbi:CLUMA_CG019407, isoform A [Clunio marinus]|uniref:CLUMA_CG019407, isoform A n=1 Tax=Clunio marinus TaxID=568069 RepID=A0A1J1J143_9DIPT|nr:CLUMA_CG019407, isoform A [Clunio marinus]